MSFKIDSAAPRPPGKLGVFSGGDIDVGFTVELGEFFEDDGAGWHVDAEREGFGGKD